MQIWKACIIGTIGMVVGSAGGVTYATQSRPAYVMVPSGGAKFVPLDPSNPAGLQRSVLSGSPASGPVAFLVKLPRGASPLHWHSSDYYAITIEGTSKHWLPGKEAEAKSNPPGTFWFQPGGATGPHMDECLSDSCTTFIYMPGKFDFTPIADSKSNAKK